MIDTRGETFVDDICSLSSALVLWCQISFTPRLRRLGRSWLEKSEDFLAESLLCVGSFLASGDFLAWEIVNVIDVELELVLL